MDATYTNFIHKLRYVSDSYIKVAVGWDKIFVGNEIYSTFFKAAKENSTVDWCVTHCILNANDRPFFVFAALPSGDPIL